MEKSLPILSGVKRLNIALNATIPGMYNAVRRNRATWLISLGKPALPLYVHRMPRIVQRKSAGKRLWSIPAASWLIQSGECYGKDTKGLPVIVWLLCRDRRPVSISGPLSNYRKRTSVLRTIQSSTLPLNSSGYSGHLSPGIRRHPPGRHFGAWSYTTRMESKNVSLFSNFY